MVAHRMRSELVDRDVRRGEVAPVLSLRGDAELGVNWRIERTGETLVLGFPDAGAVGRMDLPRGEGDCTAGATRTLTYVPDDTLDRQPKLQVQTPSCSDGQESAEVLFTGPGDFGGAILTWETALGADLWVAAPGEGLGRGAVFRFTDAAERSPDQRTFADAQMLEGEAAGDHLGQRLRRCGDLDGDGMDEMAIGIPGYTPDTDRPRAGAVAILTPDALRSRDWTLADADAVLWGEAEDTAGVDFICDEDITGDGRPDLIIGAPGGDDTEGDDAGVVWLVPGESLAEGALTALATLAWYGAPREQLGTSLAVADVDMDGTNDIIAGAPGAEGGGAVRVRFGDGAQATFGGREAVEVDGLGVTARLGAQVGAADLDEDGLPEVIGSAWRLDRDGLRLHAGEIVGWGGTSASARRDTDHAENAFTIAGTASHQEVGRVLFVEDIDRDGAIDIVTTARRRAQ